MKIETYEIEEMKSSDATTMACDAEAIELINKLGMDGLKSGFDADKLTRFPYPRLTTTQELVFSALCPTKVTLESCRVMPPLRVLQVAAYCREMPQGKYMWVLHSPIPKDDPILISAPSEYSSEKYLLARWGDELLPFEEMKVKALPIIKAKLMAEFSRVRAKLDDYIRAMDDWIPNYIETGDKPTANAYD